MPRLQSSVYELRRRQLTCRYDGISLGDRVNVVIGRGGGFVEPAGDDLMQRRISGSGFANRISEMP
jgi:hypothetical protein